MPCYYKPPSFREYDTTALRTKADKKKFCAQRKEDIFKNAFIC